MPQKSAPLLIRPLLRREAAALRDLRLEALRLHPEAFGASFEEAERMSAAQFAAQIPEGPPDAIFGAFLGGAAVPGSGTGAAPALRGMAGFFAERPAKTRHKGSLWGMYVQPAARRHGVAQALLQRVIRHAREVARLEVLRLTVVEGNAAAHRLYEAAGFETYGIERRALRLGPEHWLDEELMALDLRRG
jgi:RimJ/RimL family protein N-acetyltransferase